MFVKRAFEARLHVLIIQDSHPLKTIKAPYSSLNLVTPNQPWALQNIIVFTYTNEKLGRYLRNWSDGGTKTLFISYVATHS